MKIDSSRYTMFWSNPERYRLREIWKLAPAEPKAGTFASLLTFGRRRGTAFHELMDAAYRGVSEFQAIQELKDGGFDDKVIEMARDMVAVVRERYPDEKYLAHEALFEVDIPGSPHQLVGRIDHVLDTPDGPLCGDWKTSKYRPKRDLQFKGEEYCRGSQVGFYLLGCRYLGFGEQRRFLYRLVSSGSKGSRAKVNEFPTERTGIQLNELMRSVSITCDLIQWLKETYGIERHWPNLPERFDGGYSSILGKKMYPEYVPDGFTAKVEHLELMKESA